MPARVPSAFAGRGLTLRLPAAASPGAPAAKGGPCQLGPSLLVAGDGTVSACRMAAAAERVVGPPGGNGRITCSAGSRVEFHRNGYLAFCERAGATGSYVTRARRPTRCNGGSRVAFDENGYLEYCS